MIKAPAAEGRNRWLVIAGALALCTVWVFALLLSSSSAIRASHIAGTAADWALFLSAIIAFLSWTVLIVRLKAWRSFNLFSIALGCSPILFVLAGSAFNGRWNVMPPLMQHEVASSPDRIATNQQQPVDIQADNPIPRTIPAVPSGTPGSAAWAPIGRPTPAAQPSAPQDYAPATTQAPSLGSYELPVFKMPPPLASASYVLPRSMFTGLTTVGQITHAIVSALEMEGYVEHSFTELTLSEWLLSPALSV
jgi:hypothetical protein